MHSDTIDVQARKARKTLPKTAHISTIRQNCCSLAVRRERTHWLRRLCPRVLTMAVFPAVIALAGCGASNAASNSSNGAFSISPGTATIDTNCTGCNQTSTSGMSVEQFSATLAGGGAANVTWSVSGGDVNSKAGTISASGQYTPPSYLTANSVQVTVTAALVSNPSTTASAVLTITPGFLQPLTPENVAVASAGTVTITGYIAESGGSTGISYALSNARTGSSGGLGSLGPTTCSRISQTFTNCSVTYTAPATVTSTVPTYVVATIGTLSTESSVVLLNTADVSSNPATHQVQQTSAPITLGSSGGNNNDYDTSGNQIVDCCSGTLGSLIQNSSGTQYLLSNNHVLARSDQGHVGDIIVQPGLIDNNCTPFPGSGTTEVGALIGWIPLNTSSTNADAAIAQVDSGTVNTSGNILELGARQSNGTLAAAPPGISSTAGKGEAASVGMTVAKSGRTTGLTCGSVSTVSLDVEVSYYTNCAETDPYYTKTYTNQVGIEGNQFSDAGDSGSLVVDTSDAEPVGLFFAGGITTGGVSEGVANPVSDVLSELGTSPQVGNGTTSYSFVGTTDHQVSCLNYGNATVTAAQARTLSATENDRIDQALAQARTLVNPSMGILGIAPGKSSDHAGEGAIVLYVDQNMNVSAPATINGVRTVLIPTSAAAVSTGAAPQSLESVPFPALQGNVLNRAIAAKQSVALNLMRQNPAFFGVGVGQSLDDPREAALIVYVDRNQVPANLPATINGLRVRYVIMERLHVTRSYATGVGLKSQSHCMPQPARGSYDLIDLKKLRGISLE